jgi:two-component system chemotaxis response regulator CheB
MFRSAAVAHRSRAIGLVLSGTLDNGSAGLASIKRCGGLALVQNPEDARCPDMTRNAASAI